MHDPSSASLDTPVFDVAVVGLDTQHVRLIEIVFRHIRYNRYGFRLVAGDGLAHAHVLIAGVGESVGRDALARARAVRPPVPAIAVVADGDAGAPRPAIEVSRLVRQLLPILNRVVELEGLAASPPRQRDPPDPPRGDSPPGPPGRAPPARDAIVHVAAPAGDALAMARARIAHPADRPRVLVVEDSVSARALLTQAIGRMGLDVDTAGSAGEALVRLASRRFDLAMLDVALPGVDGLRLARRIRREPTLGRLPIVALGNRPSLLDIVRGAAAGFDAYLGTPVGLADLRRTVAGQLGRVLDPDTLPPQLKPAPA